MGQVAVKRALVQLTRIVVRGHGKHRGQPSHRVKRDAIRDSRLVKDEDEHWILDLLPPASPEEHQ